MTLNSSDFYRTSVSDTGMPRSRPSDVAKTNTVRCEARLENPLWTGYEIGRRPAAILSCSAQSALGRIISRSAQLA